MSSSSQVIEVVVDPKGEAIVQTKGFSGPSCRDASRALERALGVVQADTPTAEMYQSQPVGQPLRQGNG